MSPVVGMVCQESGRGSVFGTGEIHIIAFIFVNFSMWAVLIRYELDVAVNCLF